MARYVNIPAYVWQRLAALDHVCDMRLERHNANTPGAMTSRRNYSRVWRVEIWRRDDGEASRMTTEGADLAGVLDLAVRQAEGKWGGR